MDNGVLGVDQSIGASANPHRSDQRDSPTYKRVMEFAWTDLPFRCDPQRLDRRDHLRESPQ
jgi:hypothetical protein